MEEYAEYEVEQQTQIVPIGGLAQFVSDSQRLFKGIIDSKTAKDAVKRIEAVKKLMEAAEQYGAYASQFCEQEALLFFRIAEIEGSEDELSAAKRRMVDKYGTISMEASHE